MYWWLARCGDATRLLILEDDDRIRAALRLALTDEGYDVRDLATGEAALAVVANEPIDLMLVDLMRVGWTASRSSAPFGRPRTRHRRAQRAR